MEKLGDKIFFLGRVIESTARGHSVEASLKYIQDTIVVLGLRDSRPPPPPPPPVSTPSVKRTPTTESLVELETERRAVCSTAVGKLLYMCQERADIMYSVKETARKIMCPTESDEMNMKRKCTQTATGQDNTKRARAPAVESRRTLSAWSRTQQSVSLSSAEAELYALKTGISKGMVAKHVLNEVGYEVSLVNHIDSQSAKAWAS